MPNRNKSNAYEKTTPTYIDGPSQPGRDIIPSTQMEFSAKSSSNPDQDLAHFFNLPIKDLLQNEFTGLFITGEKDILLWMNNVVKESPSMGPEVEITLGKPAIKVLHYLQEFVAYPYSVVEMAKELLRKRKTFIGYEFLLKDGRTMNLDYYPVYHEGKFRGALWQVTDFSKRLEQYKNIKKEADHSLTDLVDMFQLPYCETDTRGNILLASTFFAKMTEFPEGKLPGKNLFDFCGSGSENLKKSIRRNLTVVSRKAEPPVELELILRNGNAYWVSCQLVFTRDDQDSLRTVRLLFTDISEQKNVQKDLEYAKNLAETALRTQQQFLASMSHDIRTPLNAIIGMVFLLQDTPLNGEQTEYIKVLRNSSNILLGMLNGVLDFAKIESGKQEVHQREIDLPHLVQSLMDTLSYRIINKPVKLSCHVDERINTILLGDDILLSQILMNLLGNAEKFTAKGGISIEATLVKEFNSAVWIEFKVKDTGIGISKERQKDIFQDFMQADEDIRATYGGTGLGLFICKKLVETLGGTISVESVPGKGTVFSFSIPFTLTRELLTPPTKLPVLTYSFEGKGVRLLVVEDNPMNLKYLSSLLNKYHIDFDIATNGELALEMANEKFYNLVLMDMKLPGMNGLEIASRIREDENPNTATPIVLVSAAAFRSTVDNAKEAGVNELLAKPYTPHQLLDILLKYLIEEEVEHELDRSALEEDPNSFKFDERLDTKYLQKLYTGNCAYATSLFEVFVQCMEMDWEELKQALIHKDWKSLKDLVHKVKPNFSMVGLTWITGMMEEVYSELKTNNIKKAVLLLANVQKEMDKMMPLIKSELARMEAYVEQSIP